MQQLNKIIDTLSEDVLNGTGEKTSKLFLFSFFIALISCIFLLFIISFCASVILLLQSYLAGHVSYQKPVFSLFGVSHGIQEFQYLCLWLIGFLLLGISSTLPLFIPKTKFAIGKYPYFSFSTGVLILTSSIFLGISQNFITFDSGEYWGQLMLLVSFTGFCFSLLSQKYSSWQRYFRLLLIAALIVRAYHI